MVHRARFRSWLFVGVKQRPEVADESMPAAVLNERRTCRARDRTIVPESLARIVRGISGGKQPSNEGSEAPIANLPGSRCDRMKTGACGTVGR
jgi:hypothetical protein